MRPPSSKEAATASSSVIRQPLSYRPLSMEDQERFNDPCPRPQTLLAELDLRLGTSVPGAFWAMMLLCDMQELVEMMAVSRRLPEFMALVCTNSYSFLKSSLQYRQWALWASTRAMQDIGKISMTRVYEIPLRIAARERDRGMCPFTKNDNKVEVAQVCPSFLISEEKEVLDLSFWILLSILWGPEKVSRWHQALASMTCANFICMESSVHDWFASNVFTLRPLEYNHSKTELEVEWYWQSFYARLSLPGYVDLTNQPHSSSRERGSCDTKGYWCEIPLDVGFVKSGHKFVLRTSDPVGYPLPSRDLLELQWYLNRLASMSWPQSGRTFSNTTSELSSDDGDNVQVTVREVGSASSPSDDSGVQA